MGFDLFEEGIEDNKEEYDLDMAQTEAILKSADLINNIMQNKGLTQSDLAKMLKVSRGYVSKVLSGYENISVKNIAKILHVLGHEYVQYSVPLGNDVFSIHRFSCGPGQIKNIQFGESKFKEGDSWFLNEEKIVKDDHDTIFERIV